MWSVVEKRTTRKPRVEYEDYTSMDYGLGWDSRKCCGAARNRAASQGPRKKYDGASVLIKTTTPWTLPGVTRPSAYSPKIARRE